MRFEPLFIRFPLQFYETAVIYNLKVEMLWPGHCCPTKYNDPTHSPMFNQIEGLMIDKDVSFPALFVFLF